LFGARLPLVESIKARLEDAEQRSLKFFSPSLGLFGIIDFTPREENCPSLLRTVC